MNCKRCGNSVSPAKRECQACGEDNGYPNVRLAQLPEEQTELTNRINAAEVSTHARKCKNVLDKFGAAACSAQVVISRPLAAIQNLLESDRQTYTSYQRQLTMGARIPEDNIFDQTRTQFESALFPNFFQDILFGCLSIDGHGLSSYGAYAMVLKEETISHRATVFEENPYVFCTKHGILMNAKIPSGYRATWEDRGKLAKAKLHSEITPTTRDDEFPRILLKDGKGTADADYIEVHIFGPLNRYSIERVIGRMPHAREDRAIWNRIKRLLESIGARMEAT